MKIAEYKFDLPYYHAGVLLNINNYYRDYSEQERRNIKLLYSMEVLDMVVPKMNLYTIRTKYVFHGRHAKRNDKNNVCTLIDKFLMDYLVYKKYLIDDCNSFVKNTVFSLGSVDNKNPRVSVTIEANKIPSNLSRKIR